MRTERLDLRPERPDLRPGRLNLRTERPDMKPERSDFRLEMPDLRPEMPDLRPERPDLRPYRPDGGGEERTNELTNGRMNVPLCSTGLHPLRGRCPKMKQNPRGCIEFAFDPPFLGSGSGGDDL